MPHLPHWFLGNFREVFLGYIKRNTRPPLLTGDVIIEEIDSKK